MSYLQIALQIVLMFFVLVTLHEWGHFYFAKRAGILVREFAIGFGPKLFSYKRGETKYTLRLLPIGGYVRMAGEDPELVQIAEGQTIAVRLTDDRVTHLFLDQLDRRSDVVQGVVRKFDLEKDLFVELDVDGEPLRLAVHPQAMLVARGQETQIAPLDRQFASKTVGQRALAIFAGPVMNFLLALVLFVILMFIQGVPSAIKLSTVESGMPADRAGLMAGDIVREVDGEPIGTDGEKLTGLIKASKDKPMTWIIERDGEQLQKQVVPTDRDGNTIVGVGISWEYRGATLWEAVSGAGKLMVRLTEQIMIGFKMLVLGQFTLDDLGGPVRIVEVSSQHAQAGPAAMIYWSGLLSLYLGIFNLLPIPALDGSRLVFLGIEALRGKPVEPSRESMVHFIGFAMLMLLMIAVTYNDILRLIKG